MAARQRWPVSDEMKQRALQAAMDVLEAGNPREKIAAAALIAAVEKQNQADDHKVVDIATGTSYDRISEIARDLGIEESVILDATSESDSGTEGDQKLSGDGP
jgi:hypothetical protein